MLSLQGWCVLAVLSIRLQHLLGKWWIPGLICRQYSCASISRHPCAEGDLAPCSLLPCNSKSKHKVQCLTPFQRRVMRSRVPCTYWKLFFTSKRLYCNKESHTVRSTLTVHQVSGFAWNPKCWHWNNFLSLKKTYLCIVLFYFVLSYLVVTSQRPALFWVEVEEGKNLFSINKLKKTHLGLAKKKLIIMFTYGKQWCPFRNCTCQLES